MNPIGKIAIRDDEKEIELKREYISILTGLDGFDYIQSYGGLTVVMR